MQNKKREREKNLFKSLSIAVYLHISNMIWRLEIDMKLHIDDERIKASLDELYYGVWSVYRLAGKKVKCFGMLEKCYSDQNYLVALFDL